MIKAYHQVGSEQWNDAQLREVLEGVLSRGKIEPAITRLDRGDMEKECFTGLDRGATIDQRFEGANPKVLAALKAIARDKLKKLPRSGLVQSLFNCVDLIAGDLELIFLKPEEWYSLQNGFVFDAEELLRKGARFRPTDLLGNYNYVIEQLAYQNFRTVTEAREAVEEALRDERDTRELTGQEGIWDLKECIEHAGDYSGEEGTCNGEIVWRGALPLDLAIEVWQNGEEITDLVQSA